MVGRGATRLVLGLGVAAALGAALGSCKVTVTKDDVLRKAWRCEDDVDCVDGWKCRAFPFDPNATHKYCVLPCASDEHCRFGDVCGNEGFCVEPCDLRSPGCRDEKFECLRWNMTPDDQTGYCQPADPCSDSSDCAPPFNQCLSSVLLGVSPEVPLETDQTACVASCATGQECTDGYACLPEVLSQFVPAEGVPDVCVPLCGEDNVCPDGYRCLIDSLDEAYPGHDFDPNDNKVCFPGLSGSGLPCRQDRDCLTGRCVQHPSLDLPGGGAYFTCALPCETACDDLSTECLQAEHDGQTSGFCFQPFRLCESSSQCGTGGDECFDLSQIRAGSICLQPCSGPRDPSCPAGFTCIPSADSTQANPRYGCYHGLPGFPCADGAQCHQGYGEGTECLSPTGQPADAICTKACEGNGDCTFGALTGAAPYCATDTPSPVCQALGFGCGDPSTPYECSGGLSCFFTAGPQSPQICSVACPGVRAAARKCPDSYGCTPLPQGGTSIATACVIGYPALVPCSRDSECWDAYRDGSAQCRSITGQAPEKDGVCSVPCQDDADCGIFFSVGGQIETFCLPGSPAPGAGAPGYCYGNPSLDVLLGLSYGQQGTFCEDTVLPVTCESGLDCVSPLRDAVQVANSSPKFCAKRCERRDDCSQVPTAHDCLSVGIVDEKHCRPTSDELGRAYKAPCTDHRQCAWGVCFFESSSDVVGYCTKLCETNQQCPGSEFPNAECASVLRVCRPQNGFGAMN